MSGLYFANKNENSVRRLPSHKSDLANYNSTKVNPTEKKKVVHKRKHT